ncbi:MAG: hypothetical protein IKR86_07620 [Candidatus Methanomethylophilaceae archaeon]|nr:hypothetical protein [Candidatus Methanomethylophilaceae archaeon]
MNGSTWGAITMGALLLSVVLGIVIFLTTGQVLDVVWAVLIVFGLFLAITSVARGAGKNNSNFGASYGDSTMVGGIILAGIGAAGLVQTYTGNVLITVAVFIAIIAITGIVMAIKNRNA